MMIQAPTWQSEDDMDLRRSMIKRM